MPAGVNGTLAASYSEVGHFVTIAAGAALNLDSSAATAHGGWVVYVEI